MSPAKPVAIGIDLGTSNSVTAVWKPELNSAVTIKDLGKCLTPSVVAFTDQGERLVGAVAKQQQSVNPKNTVHGIKQIIGRQFVDREVATASRHWPFKVVRGNDGTCRILVTPSQSRATHMRPEEVSAAVLSRLVANARAKLNAPISGAVITVPAGFGDAQRTATRNAATIAGLKVLKLMNEPSAAAYAYGATELDSSPRERHMLIFDLGGGTLDLAVLYIPGTNTAAVNDDEMKLKAVDADLTLGGDTFTGHLAQYCLEQLPGIAGVDPIVFRRPLVRRAIYKECENAKRLLSECRNAKVSLQLAGEASAQLEITRDKFEELCEEDFQRIYEPLQRVLAEAGLQRKDIDRVLLVGGSTRIPKIREILSDFFGNNVELNEQVEADEAVAHGAAIEAARLSGALKQPVLRSVSHDPNTMAEHIQAMENLRVTFSKGQVDQGTRITHHSFVTAPVPRPQPIALQLPQVNGSFDVLPHTLSVVYNQGECWQMLMANTPYPAQQRQEFAKQWPDQGSITISIMEGPSLRAYENQLLGRFEVAGLRHLPSGILVTFAINSSGIIEVSAQALDDATREKRITVRPVDARLSDHDLKKLQEEEARQQEDEALKRKQDVDPRLLKLLQELLQSAEEQRQNSLASPQTLAHVQRITAEARRMYAEGELLSAEAVEDLIYQLENIPIAPEPSMQRRT